MAALALAIHNPQFAIGPQPYGNRIGPYSETSSNLDTFALSTSSFCGPHALTRTVLVPVFAPLYLVYHLAPRYILGLATLLLDPRYTATSELDILLPRSSVLGPRYARTANSGKTTSPNRVKV
jgi:hypothetical protein